jgi:4-carboxymuconolactone decarboxylase
MSDKWQTGHDLMVSMMGPQFAAGVEGAARAGNFGSDIARMAVEFAFGDVWSRSGLERKQRSIVVISSLITQGKIPELKNHLRFGLNNGLTATELQEILIQALPYVGFPAIADAMTATIEVLRERGLDAGVKTAHENKTL